MSWYIWMPVVAGIVGGLIGGLYYKKNQKKNNTGHSQMNR